jgi:flagellar motor switch protein FliG
MASHLSGEAKAAILLRLIGEEAAAQVMQHLDPKEIKKIGASMTVLSQISKEDEQVVIQEFQRAAGSGGMVIEGKDYIKTVLTKALGPEKAQRILEAITSTTYPGIESLKWLDPRSIAQLIKAEHPQTIAVILAHLDPEQGSQVLAQLPDRLRAEVALRLATTETVQPEVLQQLSDVLQESFKLGSASRNTSLGGAQTVAELLARLDKSAEQVILNTIAEHDPALADTIRSLMFVFDDLVKVDDRGIQELLKEIDKNDLAIALRGASPEVKEKFLRNMSSRAAEMLKEDMEARGPVKVSDVEKAQQTILKVCRQLEEEGRLVVAGQGEAVV